MLFGLFFGAGNLIFPVQLGQLSGAHVNLATLGFLTTAIGIPFLGVVAIGVSKSNGLFELASRVHPAFGYLMTILLYLTIGPFFAWFSVNSTVCPFSIINMFSFGIPRF